MQGQSADTVRLRVQVVDMQSQTLDLVLPTYLPARDLSQRVARDAGLQAFWADGRRRAYWVRARGRVMQENETLADLGVVRQELIHLLPQPPDSRVVEQNPDYPEAHAFAVKGTPALVAMVLVVCAWAVAWGFGLSVERSTMSTMLPALGLGLLSVSLARLVFGGEGWRSRVAFVGLVIGLVLFVLALMIPVAYGVSPALLFFETLPGLVMDMVGVLFGWLAWWGAVEPLQKLARHEEGQAEEAAPLGQCGICGLDVQEDVRTTCQYSCGRVFHTGCYSARMAVYRGDPSACGICGAQVQ